MTVIKALQGTGKVDVKVIIRRIRLLGDPCEVAEKVFVHVCCEWLWGFELIVDGRMECESLVNDLNDLFTTIMNTGLFLDRGEENSYILLDCWIYFHGCEARTKSTRRDPFLPTNFCTRIDSPFHRGK